MEQRKTVEIYEWYRKQRKSLHIVLTSFCVCLQKAYSPFTSGAFRKTVQFIRPLFPSNYRLVLRRGHLQSHGCISQNGEMRGGRRGYGHWPILCVHLVVYQTPLLQKRMHPAKLVLRKVIKIKSALTRKRNVKASIGASFNSLESLYKVTSHVCK